MTRCPSCFQQLPDHRYKWVCVSGQCAKRPDPVASAFLSAPVETSTEMVFEPVEGKNWRRPAGVRCRECSGPVAQVCVFCNFRLPERWYESDAVCIAMAGARNTGKSVSIGVMIHFLREVLITLGSSMSWGNEQSREVYLEHYEKALFREMGILKPTPAMETAGGYQREPLIVSLGQIHGQHRYLCVRDVAGEDLEHGVRGRHNLGFFVHADLVVFLFDPLTVPGVAETLRGVIPGVVTSVDAADPLEVLGTVLGLIGEGNAHLAVVLSKFDALQKMGGIADHAICKTMENPGAGIMRSTGDSAVYDEQDAVLVHEEVRGLLQVLRASAVVNSVENPLRGRPFVHRFMAISSLGSPVAGSHQSINGIAPFRVLDPIRWILHDRGIIDAAAEVRA